LAMAFQCQRLRNGNTFMAGRNVIQEVDPSGKEVFNLHRTDHLISVRRFRDGQTAYLTNQGNYVRLDAAGKEVKTFRVPMPGTGGLSAAEVLPNDRVLVSLQYENKAIQYDASSKRLWEASIPMPGNLTRLPNGNTLVVSGNSTGVTELDRSGRVVGEWKNLSVHPWRVDRR
jgi:hypothetical protein